MGLVDVAIPLSLGLLLAFGPARWFTKAHGDALLRATATLRKIGYALLAVAALYLLVRPTALP